MVLLFIIQMSYVRDLINVILLNIKFNSQKKLALISLVIEFHALMIFFIDKIISK